MSVTAFLNVRSTIKYDPDDTSIYDVTFDAATSETTNDSNTITRHPVELGTDIADHNFANPRKWVMNYLVTNTPFVETTIARGANTAVSRSISAWEVVQRIRNSALVFDLVTELEIQTNVQIVGLDVTQDKDTSQMLAFTANIEALIITESVTVPFPKEQLSPTIQNQTQSNTAAGLKQKVDNRTITKKLSDFTGLSTILGIK